MNSLKIYDNSLLPSISKGGKGERGKEGGRERGTDESNRKEVGTGKEHISSSAKRGRCKCLKYCTGSSSGFFASKSSAFSLTVSS